MEHPSGEYAEYALITCGLAHEIVWIIWKVELGINRFDFLLIVEFYRIMEYGVDPRLLGFQKKNEIKIQEDKQLDKFTYTGSKIKNQFTAYILAQIRGARQNYLRKMLRISRNEMPAEDLTMEEMGISVEESLELKYREELLLKEADGDYPKWDEMKDQKLVEALLLLREDERKLIYQHVFEERTFDDMSRINGLSPYKVKGIYYYAIRKIRKWMGGAR